MPKIRFSAHIAVLLSLLLLAGGCATLGPASRHVSPQAQAAYARAETLYRNGDFQAAAAAFLAAAGTDRGIRGRATVAAAASFRSLGRIDEAAKLLARVQRTHLAPDDAARYRILSADITLQRGQPDAALKQLADLPKSLPAGVQQHALDVEARADIALGNRLAAVRALVKRGTLLPADAQAGNREQAVSILAGMGDNALNALYASLADDDPLKPYVRLALGRGGTATARVLPRPRQPVGTRSGPAAAPQGYAMPSKVALLLPATGPLAAAAAAVRDGFFAAYFHTPIPREQRPVLAAYDTGGTPEGALAAYRQAVADGAQRVVGPLGRDEVAAILGQSSLPVPVLALNHAAGDVATPTGSAEFALLPESEGAQLAAHMITLGLHAAIVFRADNPTASRTFDAFRVQFESLGGKLAAAIVLPAGGVDFAAQIQTALAATAPATGIVVLLRPEQARLLLPQLTLARSTLPVFATSMVYSGNEDATADGDLDGVQFCDEPWLFGAQAGLPDHATLASLLDTASGPAGRLFGFGMDAYTLVPYLDWLASHPGSYVSGATGQLTMATFGQVQRTPIWLRFRDGIARPVAANLEPQPVANPVPIQP